MIPAMVALSTVGLWILAVVPPMTTPPPPQPKNASEACQPPELPLAEHRPNVLMIGDSISEGPSGYALFVRDLLQTDYWTNRSHDLVGTVQHGGGMGDRGQMASSANGVNKCTGCIGNTSGTLPAKAWSVVTYNAGLHDCDKESHEYISPAEYSANLRGIFTTLIPAAHAVIFVTTTPLPGASDHGIAMDCIRQYNEIAKQVAAAGGHVVSVSDLWGDVETFCNRKGDDLSSDGNYTRCAIQCTGVGASRDCSRTGMHFMNTAPFPSGQQYTALSVANAIIRKLSATAMGRRAAGKPLPPPPPAVQLQRVAANGSSSCGAQLPPRNTWVPNVLVLGDVISSGAAGGAGYGPNLRQMLEHPRPRWTASPQAELNATGSLAAVQHGGGWGVAGTKSAASASSATGAQCAKFWVGDGGWDVIALNFGLLDCLPSASPLAMEYVTNLEAVYHVARAGLAPGGKILWLPTTPVSTNNSLRINASCVSTANALASKLFAPKPDVVIGDLDIVLAGVCESDSGDGADHYCPALQQQDGVHFTRAGQQFTAVVVAHAISRLLGTKWAALISNSSGGAPPPPTPPPSHCIVKGGKCVGPGCNHQHACPKHPTRCCQ
eukprot:SAG31_NODE_3857_length_3815_cov_2.961518_3_plen_607_part_00